MDYTIRKATEADRFSVALAVSVSFEKVFSVFTKDMRRMAKVFEAGIVIDRFFLAEQNGEIIGVLAYGDRESRVISSTKEICRENLGLIRGKLAFRAIRSELMKPHTYPANTAFVDIVGVLPQARGKGVAKGLLAALIKNSPQYNEFVLDVDSINAPAIKSYTNFGFVEFKRVPVIKFFKRAKIYMKYTAKRGEE